jgi:hypothetical protein
LCTRMPISVPGPVTRGGPRRRDFFALRFLDI